MRTLKKTLAFVLVLAMVVSLGAMGASAAFTDVADDTDYSEAIQVLTGIGVINGMTATTFDPAGSLTRAQAAKIVAYLKLGPTNAKLVSSATSQMFTDVPTSYWGAGYIEYCANLGIIAGNGDGTFAPEGTLTTAAFTKMLLCAVGFDAEEEGFVGDGWAINVASAAVEAELYDSDIAISALNNCTRAQACQLAYKALFYSADGTTTKYTVDNEAGTFTFDTLFEAYIFADNNGGLLGTKIIATDSLADKIFKLTKGTGADSFGRPATIYSKASWDEDMTFADDATFTFTAKTSAKTMASTLKGYTFDVAGYLISDDVAAVTGNGVTVEVYAGDDKVIDAVVVIAPVFVEVDVLAKAQTKLVGAYTKYTLDLGAGDVSYKVFSSVVDEDADVSDATVTGTVEDGDMVLAYTNTAKTHLYIEAVDTFAGILTSISSAGAYTIDGSAYKLAAAGTAPAIKKSSQTFYVDSFGYILGTVAAASVTNYAFVVDTDSYNTLVDGRIVATYSAILAYADGTTEEVETVDGTTSTAVPKDYTATLLGQVVTYKEGVKGVELTAATTEVTLATGFTKNTATLVAGTLYANSATKFVFANYDEDGIDGTVTVYTGIANVPTITGAALQIYAVDTDSTADAIANVVFIYSDVISTTTDSYVYYTGSYVQTSDGYALSVVKGGELTTITVASLEGTDLNDATANTLYSSIEDDGATTTYTPATTTYDKVKNVGGLLFVNDAYDSSKITATTPVYVIDKYDDEVIVKTFADITTAQSSTDNVYIVLSDTTVTAIYVVVDSAA